MGDVVEVALRDGALWYRVGQEPQIRAFDIPSQGGRVALAVSLQYNGSQVTLVDDPKKCAADDPKKCAGK